MVELSVFHRLQKASLKALVHGGAAVVASAFAKRDPLAAQRSILQHLVHRGAATRFGRDHGLAEFSKRPFPELYREFRKRVPIRSYEDFWQEYFCHGYRAEEGSLLLDNVTWPGKIRFFCETSGTTAPTKLIPFSAEMFAANKTAARDLAACYLHRQPESRLVPGKLLYMAGNTRLTARGAGVVSGDMSAITLLHPPAYLKPFIAPDPSLSALPWEEKVEALARLLLADRGICAISGVPPWILLLLQRCRELGGKALPELLPGLELIIHGGTSMKPYSQEFAALFASKAPHYLELLPSSEGFMAFQLCGEEFMRFTPYYGVFFEFVPFAQLDAQGRPGAQASALPLEEVAVGERYAVILTPCAGLWRYHLGDTIRFVSLAPLQIEFTGRDKFLDRFEEKVTQGEVEEAIATLNRMEGIDIREFMVGPDIYGRRHLWILAMGGKEISDHPRLGECLDRKLQTMNADYAAFRSQGRIRAPLVVTTRAGTIYQWSKEVRGKLGGQSKIPHIDPTVDGEMIASLLRFTGWEPSPHADS